MSQFVKAIAGVCGGVVLLGILACRSSDPLFENKDAAGGGGGSFLAGGASGQAGSGSLGGAGGAVAGGETGTPGGASGQGGSQAGASGGAGAGGAAGGSGSGGTTDAAATGGTSGTDATAGADGPPDGPPAGDAANVAQSCGSSSCNANEVCVITTVAGGVPGSGTQTTYACQPRPDGCPEQPDCTCGASLCPMTAACFCRIPAADTPTLRCDCAAP